MYLTSMITMVNLTHIQLHPTYCLLFHSYLAHKLNQFLLLIDINHALNECTGVHMSHSQAPKKTQRRLQNIEYIISTKCHEQTTMCGEGYTTQNIPVEVI